MDGKSKRWDLVESLPSVAVALYHADLDSLVVVRQFRPAVYAAACREVGERRSTQARRQPLWQVT